MLKQKHLFFSVGLTTDIIHVLRDIKPNKWLIITEKSHFPIHKKPLRKRQRGLHHPKGAKSLTIIGVLSLIRRLSPFRQRPLPFAPLNSPCTKSASSVRGKTTTSDVQASTPHPLWLQCYAALCQNRQTQTVEPQDRVCYAFRTAEHRKHLKVYIHFS